MEAMACGTPWISTDAGALPETVGDARVLVPLGEAGHANSREVVEAMVAAALRVMRDPDHADILRTAGRARATELSWAPVAEQVAELARATIAKPRSVPAPAVARTKGLVAIATPVYGYLMHSMCTRSLMMTITRLRDDGYEAHWLTVSTSSIRQGRNLLAASFLAMPEATHIMWVDADVSFPGDAVSRLVAHDLPMVAGLYPFKRLPPEFAIHLARDDQGHTRRLPSGAVEATEVPGGFVLVKREVYLALMEAFPERAALCAPAPEPGRQIMAHAPWSFDFYSEHVDRGLLVSEDYAFCRLWRSIGGTVWVDLSIRLTHYGMHGFAGDPMELFAPETLASEAARAPQPAQLPWTSAWSGLACRSQHLVHRWRGAASVRESGCIRRQSIC